MLYELGNYAGDVGALNVFKYITFRTGGAIITGLLVVFLFGRPLIDLLRLKQGKGQPIREDGPQSHLLTKKGTPTMGGLMILLGLVVATLLWANWASAYVWIVLGVTLAYGAIGFFDDYLKVTKQRASHFFSGRFKMALELVVAGLATCAVMQVGDPAIRAVADVSVRQGCSAVPRAVLPAGRPRCHRRRRQCGEPHRRPRRPRHRAGDDRRLHLRPDRLPVGQRGVRQVSADPPRAGHRRTGGHLRCAARRRPWLPVVQCAAGDDLHGRHRFARPWRCAGVDRASPPSTRSCSPSSAACSSSKRCR